MYSQSELFMVIRQLEFAIIQLTQQIAELIDTTQYVLLGKLSINLFNPITLHNILKNISLHLPENYELTAGKRIKNIFLYYELIKIGALRVAHHDKLVLDVPLRSATHHFILYKIVALPSRIFNDTFVNIRLNIHISGSILFSSSTSYLQKEIEDYAPQEVSLCALPLEKFLVR